MRTREMKTPRNRLDPIDATLNARDQEWYFRTLVLRSRLGPSPPPFPESRSGLHTPPPHGDPSNQGTLRRPWPPRQLATRICAGYIRVSASGGDRAYAIGRTAGSEQYAGKYKHSWTAARTGDRPAQLSDTASPVLFINTNGSPPRLLPTRAHRIAHKLDCIRRSDTRARACTRRRGKGRVLYMAFNSPPGGDAIALVAAVGAGTRLERGHSMQHGPRGGSRTKERGVNKPWTARPEALSVSRSRGAFLKEGSNSRCGTGRLDMPIA
ncbi:hypothetical protein HETIRDRAFT_455424 [Heterobasidion irregulare TC 32-1]|uniref:Uncharacterized protein n=1 Tax=Heterobasidion irregulare (strain TC 32-1) TaxID=747525 RepID=W4JRL6_HETIT|nr:uncharacterized protein HETIRDRAFT_455424 [Heterobasidion irregulare TC 32-1]ETW75725.1 hypothetical protein HETIRDRAFT_455424 [Heterobasidion irregulare TC 32-1]